MTVVSKALKPTLDKWEWQYDGACRDLDPEQFFLDPNMRGLNKKTKELDCAKDVANIAIEIESILRKFIS